MTLKTLLFRLFKFVLVLMVLVGIFLIFRTGDVQQSLISVVSVSALFFLCMVPMIVLIWMPLKNMNKKYQNDENTH